MVWGRNACRVLRACGICVMLWCAYARGLMRGGAWGVGMRACVEAECDACARWRIDGSFMW